MKAAVLGYGTVGSGVVHVIDVNHDRILERSGVDLTVKYVLDLRDFPGDPIQERLVHSFETIEQDPEISLVAEVMGGTQAAYEFTKRLLCSGKNVCTSNKELVALHGTELLELAREHQVSYLFEASCGGGIPLIRPLRTCLAQEVIDEIAGIVNGTTNYILSRMIEDGSEFEAVLKQAQDMGYAERNPEADVEGHDACRKLAILSSLAYGKRIDYTDIYTEGISGITSADIAYAKAMGRTIKLLACSHLDEGKVLAMVAPHLVSHRDPLASVSGVFNAIFIHGNMLGDAMFYGQGAGKDATASAVVADLIEASGNQGRSVQSEWSPEKQELLEIGQSCKAFFVRTRDPQDVIEQAFGTVSWVDAGIPGETGFLTREMTEAEFNRQIGQLPGLISRLRVRN